MRLLLFITLIILWSAPAVGGVCFPREAVLAHLMDRYQEEPIGAGTVNNDGTRLEILRADDGSTWTVIISHPNGFSCLIASGEDWRPAPPPGQRIYE